MTTTGIFKATPDLVYGCEHLTAAVTIMSCLSSQSFRPAGSWSSSSKLRLKTLNFAINFVSWDRNKKKLYALVRIFKKCNSVENCLLWQTCDAFDILRADQYTSCTRKVIGDLETAAAVTNTYILRFLLILVNN